MDHEQVTASSSSTESAGPPRRRTSPLKSLLLLNVALLIVLGGVTFSARSEAQPRARGEYTMVSGIARGTNNAGAVYIVDVRNQEMVVVAWNQSEGRLDGIAYRDIRRDIEGLRGQQAPRR